MTTTARLASNTAQAISASAENSENERENEVTDDESSLTVGGWSPAGKSRKYRYTCKGGQKVCGLTITSKEDCIMCDGCKSWFHPKCQGLSVEAFRALSKYDFLWLCITASLKNMAGLVEISTGQVRETGAKIGAGFAYSGAGF